MQPDKLSELLPRPGASPTRPANPGFEEYLTQRRIPNLDGLRGLAILLVLFHHVPTFTHPWVSQLQHHANHGVSLFFVISGYIVMTLILREMRRYGAVDIKGFLWRRILRLWPLYYLVLAGEAFLVFAIRAYSPENQVLFEEKLICYALYCSNWLETSGQGPFFVSWSLAVEEQFYLLLSLMLLVFRTPWLIAITTGMLVGKVALVNGPIGLDLALVPWRILLSYSEAILLGVLLAYALDRPRLFSAFARIARWPVAVGLLMIAFLACLALTDLDNRSSLAALNLYVVCTLLVAVSAISRQLPLLGAKALSTLGLLSYGIYLMHMPVISVVKKITQDPAIVLLLTSLLVIPMAWLSFHYFEEPIRRLGRRGRASARPLAARDHSSSAHIESLAPEPQMPPRSA